MLLPPDFTLREVEYDPARYDHWLQWLAPAERALLETFAHERRRQSFLMGRVAARTLLAERLAVTPAAVPLQVAGDGAVELQGAPLHLSIAHSGTRAVAVVAERVVGVDLETIRPRRPDLYRFVCHPEEYERLERLPLDRSRALILYWALKESVLKALRTGFRLSPKKIRLEVDVASASAVARVEGDGVWQIRYEERGGCFLAVAFPG